MEWAEYSRSYDRLLLNCDGYCALQRKIARLAGTPSRSIDIGAGTGNGVMSLLDEYPESTVCAVDSDEQMLRLMREKLRRRGDIGRVQIVRSDIMDMHEVSTATFDSAIMTNVLYSVSDPAQCVREAARVLCRGGTLVVSTSWNETDVVALMNSIREELVRKGLFATLEEQWRHATRANEEMEHLITRDSLLQIRRYMEDAGLVIDDWSAREYYGSTVVLRAVKQ